MLIFVTVGLTLAIWLSQSLRFVDLIVNKGLPVVTFLYLALLLLPRFLTIVLPIALFCATLFTYNKLMNDSEFGLTAAVFTQDENAAIEIGNQIDTGTWFMNRCDYLDPALAWTGVKNSGRGCTLSSVGFEHMTRPKSYHLKLV